MRFTNEVLRSDALHFLPDDSNSTRPFDGIHLQHMHNQLFEPGQNRVIEQLQGCEMKGSIGWVVARYHLVEGSSQAVDIGAGRGLGPAILFGCRVARGTERGRIFRLPRFEVAGDTEIDQVDVSMRG